MFHAMQQSKGLTSFWSETVIVKQDVFFSHGNGLFDNKLNCVMQASTGGRCRTPRGCRRCRTGSDGAREYMPVSIYSRLLMDFSTGVSCPIFQAVWSVINSAVLVIKTAFIEGVDSVA